ncbi:MAG: hypothetical protein H6742_18235 [Alphaproteobacteria bacterium]|nr:hypothetical protein [Alphaproteobacteria bacterium]
MSDLLPIGVLVPTHPGPPADAPADRPIGRAALALHADGIDAVFGDRVVDGVLHGHVARPGRWVAAAVPVAAFYDRFPSQRRADVFADICRNLGGRPLGNSPDLTALCRDKLRCQRRLEAPLAAAGVAVPDVIDDPAAFEDRLAAWGAGFLKPRFGALGAGVRRVVPGDPLPARVRALLDDDEPALLQRAVPPPPGLAGRSVRVLAQRAPSGAWIQAPAVVRESEDDPVVNAARGARVALGEDLLPLDQQDALRHAVAAVCDALSDDPLALELGVDLVLDPDGRPWVIEVNSRPRGRLEKLAAADPARFMALHVAACARPVRTLAERVG